MFAIGDVHGCADELDELLRMLPLRAGCTVVFLGDFIDRGPKSRQVVDLVLELKRTHNVIALRGNHEAMLLEFLDGSDPRRVARFVMNGGSATLATYGDGDGRYRMPEAHLDFFQNLPLAYDTPEHFFVHAGVPNLPLAQLDPERWGEEMMWTRKTFLRSNYRWEKLIVHGHSVVESVEIASNRICLDTGCVFDRSLSAMEFPSHRIYSVPRKTEPGRVILHDASRRAAVRFRGAIPVQIAVHGQVLPFETVDFSEIGLGVRPKRREDAEKLQVGDELVGRVGGEGLFQIPFRAKVVRAPYDGLEPVFGLLIEILHNDE